jgi:hypothetical protein
VSCSRFIQFCARRFARRGDRTDRLAVAIDWRQVEKKLGKMKKASNKKEELELAAVDMKTFKQLSLEEKRAVR